MNKTDHVIYWDTLDVLDQTFYLAASSSGLVLFAGEERLNRWFREQGDGAVAAYHPENLFPYKTQFAEYLQGCRRAFSFPMDLRGTPFQISVWNALLTIPFGETVHYIDIARRIGKPSAARAVGAANGQNPISIAVPCHRVVGKDGSLTGYAGGLPLKRHLLDLESAHASSVSLHG